VVWFVKWPHNKSRFHSFGGRGEGWGYLQSRGLGYKTACQVYLCHIPKVFREPIRGIHDLLIESHGFQY
jgi:hypothetical protein